MRAIAMPLMVAVLALPIEAQAQPLPERIIEPPPAPGMPPRSGTYRDPSANPPLDFTVQPQRRGARKSDWRGARPRPKWHNGR
jgi:hypothetical protein